MIKRLLTALTLSVVLFAIGCRGSTPAYYISQDVDFSYIEKVAVLPFDNLTNERNADEVVRHFVINELLVSGVVEVVVPGEVIVAMEKQGIKAISSLSAEDIKALGKAMKVQALIFGSIEKYGVMRQGRISVPEVTITMMMAETSQGSIIWSITETGGGAGFMARHFGARTETLSETVMNVVRQAVRTLIY